MTLSMISFQPGIFDWIFPCRYCTTHWLNFICIHRPLYRLHSHSNLKLGGQKRMHARWGRLSFMSFCYARKRTRKRSTGPQSQHMLDMIWTTRYFPYWSVWQQWRVQNYGMMLITMGYKYASRRHWVLNNDTHSQNRKYKNNMLLQHQENETFICNVLKFKSVSFPNQEDNHLDLKKRCMKRQRHQAKIF